jgi:hypothetical protein
MAVINEQSIRQQSEAAYKQWAEKWRKHCKEHSDYAMKPMSDFQNSGVGKAVLCVANGNSFERSIETIVEHKDNIDILCCDKTIGHLLSFGIKPKYCMVCDASVDFDKYLAKYQDDLDETTLFISVCGNPEWTRKGNWKTRYFFTNKDVLGSEKEFNEISGCVNVIPAGTNVSNAMVILLTQSDNDGRNNFFGYDKILLTGFDYSWLPSKGYYAFDWDGGGKRQYMKHIHGLNHKGELAYTSTNLHFSSAWLHKYITTFNLPVVQCSEGTILFWKGVHKLEEQINYSFQTDDRGKVLSLMKKKRQLMDQMRQVEANLINIGEQHLRNYLATT